MSSSDEEPGSPPPPTNEKLFQDVSRMVIVERPGRPVDSQLTVHRRRTGPLATITPEDMQVALVVVGGFLILRKMLSGGGGYRGEPSVMVPVLVLALAAFVAMTTAGIVAVSVNDMLHGGRDRGRGRERPPSPMPLARAARGPEMMEHIQNLLDNLD